MKKIIDVDQRWFKINSFDSESLFWWTFRYLFVILIYNRNKMIALIFHYLIVCSLFGTLKMIHLQLQVFDVGLQLFNLKQWIFIFPNCHFQTKVPTIAFIQTDPISLLQGTRSQTFHRHFLFPTISSKFWHSAPVGFQFHINQNLKSPPLCNNLVLQYLIGKHKS